MRGCIEQVIHAVVGLSQPLMQNNDLAAAISPRAHSGNGDFCLGSQVSGASVEEDQRGGRESSGANPVSRLDPIASRRKSPDFTPDRQNLHHPAHPGQSARLGHSPAKPSLEKQTAKDKQDEGEYSFQGWQ